MIKAKSKQVKKDMPVKTGDQSVPPKTSKYGRTQGKDFVDPNAPVETKIEEKPVLTPHEESVKCSQLIKDFNNTCLRPDSPMDRLNQANAIKDILSKKRIVKVDPRYDLVEEEIRTFLNDKLRVLLGEAPSALTDEEVSILKLYCHRIKNKMESK